MIVMKKPSIIKVSKIIAGILFLIICLLFITNPSLDSYKSYSQVTIPVVEDEYDNESSKYLERSYTRYKYYGIYSIYITKTNGSDQRYIWHIGIFNNFYRLNEFEHISPE